MVSINEREIEIESEIKRERASESQLQTLNHLGVMLMTSNRASETIFHLEHDVHAYYRSKTNPNRLIHVQAYPGFSEADNFPVTIRVMDYQKFMDIRSRAEKSGGPSFGNEHEAVTENVTDGLSVGTYEDLVRTLMDQLTPGVIEGQVANSPRLLNG